MHTLIFQEFFNNKKVQTGHLQLFNNYIHYLLHLYARSVESLKRWLDQRDSQEQGYFTFSYPVHLRFSFMWYFTFLYLLHFTSLPSSPPYFTSVCSMHAEWDPFKTWLDQRDNQQQGDYFTFSLAWYFTFCIQRILHFHSCGI